MAGEPTITKVSYAVRQSDLPFTHEQLQILNAVQNSDYYTVRRLWRELNNGRMQYCVLVGESHAKPTELSRQLGEAIANNFQRFGIENADSSLTWGSSLSKPLVSAMNFFVDHFFSGVSTIDAIVDAHDQSIDNYPFVLEEIAKYYGLKTMQSNEQEQVHIQLWVDENGHLQIPKVDQKNRPWPVIKVPSLTDKRREIFTGTFNGRQIMTALNSSHINGGEIFLLEQGHQPDLAENTSSILIPTMFLTGATALVAGPLIPFAPHVAGPIFSASSRTFITIASIAVIGFLIDMFLVPEEYRNLKKFVNPIIGGLIYARDETIASNIDRIDAETPLIAVMGAAHVEDVSYLLRERYGFQDTE